MLVLILALTLLQQPQQTVAIVQGDKVEIVTAQAARTEYEKLRADNDLTQVEYARFVAVVTTLETLPSKPKCITWEQHVAEVTCWWCAPERVYVECKR